MSPIFLWKGKLLTRDQALAISPNCCCIDDSDSYSDSYSYSDDSDSIGACCHCAPGPMNPSDLGVFIGCDLGDLADEAHAGAVAQLNQAAEAMRANGWINVEVIILSPPGPSGRVPPEQCEDLGFGGCECDVFSVGRAVVVGCCELTGELVIFQGFLSGGGYSIDNCLKAHQESFCQDDVTKQYCDDALEGTFKPGLACEDENTCADPDV